MIQGFCGAYFVNSNITCSNRIWIFATKGVYFHKKYEKIDNALFFHILSPLLKMVSIVGKIFVRLFCFSHIGEIAIKNSFATVNQKTETNLNSKMLLTKIAMLVALSVATSAYAFDNNAPVAPQGWTMVDKSAFTGGHYKNVHTYEKNGDFVALVDIAGGARVKMLQYQSGTNENGHNLFWTNSLDYWWNQLPSNSSRVLVVNGQYFNSKVKSRQTTLSYSVRSETWATKSGDPNAHKKPLRQIAFFPNQGVQVTQAVDNEWVQTSAPDGLLGRDVTDGAGANSAVGRTYLCSLPYKNARASYGINPVLMIYLAKAKTQQQANNVLKEWSCDPTMALAMDGGGSSQLRLKSGKKFLSTPSGQIMGIGEQSGTREFPQAIGIFNDAN